MKSFNGIKILLVDDEPNIVHFLELGLVNEGFDVRSAHDGESALQEAASFRPQVVILDVMMPGMNGFEVCHALRTAGENIAVIMLIS